MRDYAYIYCKECELPHAKAVVLSCFSISKRNDLLQVTKTDREYAKSNGGLFKRVFDHGDHYLKVYIDGYGATRRIRIHERQKALEPLQVVCLS